MKLFLRTQSLFVFIFLISNLFSQPFFNLNCFTVLAGKNATKDGSVLFAHNEDDYGDRLVNWFLVPAKQYESGEVLVLKDGGKIPQPKETYKYLWLEMPEMDFSDSFINEWGVTIGSDACSSKEDKPELTGGGIGWDLRRLMAERARTAKEAVRIAGRLVGEFGYTGSGRTYAVADANEAWMLSVVNGKHWVAQRVPDNEVAILPNYYIISTINLDDTVNFLGSADLVGYATARGWYDPAAGEPFSFKKAYGDEGSQKAGDNFLRQWGAFFILSGSMQAMDREFTFSFVPNRKITLRDLFSVLRYHYEGTDKDKTLEYIEGSPHNMGYSTICANTTQYGFVAQLRSWLPREIAHVLWLAPRRPCTQPFIPWYACLTRVPDQMAACELSQVFENHFKPIENIFDYAPEHKFLKYARFADEADEDYLYRIADIVPARDKLELGLLEGQKDLEAKVHEAYLQDKKQAVEMLTSYTLDKVQASLMLMEKK
jgi:dipeptidase